MSPGTRSDIGISRRRAAGVLPGWNSSSLRSTAVLVLTSFRSASADLLLRNSCAKRRPTLSATMSPMTTTASRSPVTPDAMARVLSRKLNGFAKAWRSCVYHAGAFSCATSLRPNCSRRRSTSSSSSPSRLASSAVSAAVASHQAMRRRASLSAWLDGAAARGRVAAGPPVMIGAAIYLLVGAARTMTSIVVQLSSNQLLLT